MKRALGLSAPSRAALPRMLTIWLSARSSGGRAGIAAHDRQRVGVDRRHEHQLLAALDLNLVADAEPAAVVHVERRVGVRVHPGGVVDRILVGQQLILEPLVARAGRLVQRIAEQLQQRRLVRRDDVDQIRYILRQFRQGRSRRVRCFSGKSHVCLSFKIGSVIRSHCGFRIADCGFAARSKSITSALRNHKRFLRSLR